MLLYLYIVIALCFGGCRIKCINRNHFYTESWQSRLIYHIRGGMIIGLRPSIYSWLKFQPEDEGDGKVVLPRR